MEPIKLEATTVYSPLVSATMDRMSSTTFLQATDTLCAQQLAGNSAHQVPLPLDHILQARHDRRSAAARLQHLSIPHAMTTTQMLQATSD